LKTIKQMHDKSPRDYVKYFYNIRNAISNIEDNKIINIFHDTDIKTVEEIEIKKSKIVADLLVVEDECFEALETQACDTRNKGS
jgi:hypothetical protein